MRPSLTILLAISIVSATAVAGNAEKDKDTKTATMALMRGCEGLDMPARV